jgi:hypothetical protein
MPRQESDVVAVALAVSARSVVKTRRHSHSDAGQHQPRRGLDQRHQARQAESLRGGLAWAAASRSRTYSQAEHHGRGARDALTAATGDTLNVPAFTPGTRAGLVDVWGGISAHAGDFFLRSPNFADNIAACA